MKLPLGALLTTLALILAVIGYFAIVKMPLGAKEIAVVAAFCLGLVLLVRWWFLRRQKEEKTKQ
ncbi:MAG: hypothetical protein LAQ69_33990 [Acidobacteriia bacterium]|nr:hypothetical protein [Terriglobia bacterium]